MLPSTLFSLTIHEHSMTSSMLLYIEQKSLISLYPCTAYKHSYIYDVWHVNSQTTFFLSQRAQKYILVTRSFLCRNFFYTQRTITINYRQELFVLFCLLAHVCTIQRNVMVVVVEYSLVGAANLNVGEKWGWWIHQQCVMRCSILICLLFHT